jgi:rhodanese-related sulfurtransferase
MMKWKSLMIFVLALSSTMINMFIQAAMAEVPRITKEELKGMLDNPDVVIVDVRLGKDWDASEFKIKGAVRVDKNNVEALADQYPKDKTLVFYCA